MYETQRTDLLPPFSEEEGLKRDISQDLFALYENRILPPVKSDEEIIERIEEAFTIKKVDDPTADEEWAIRLSEEKRVRYAAPRFQIYKIIRDEKSALLYDNSLIKNGSYYSIIYDTQEKRFIDEGNDFIFLFKYYRGIEIGRNKYFFRNYLNNLRKVNEDKASRQCAWMWWRLNEMKKLTIECPEQGKSIGMCSGLHIGTRNECFINRSVPLIPAMQREPAECFAASFLKNDRGEKAGSRR